MSGSAESRKTSISELVIHEEEDVDVDDDDGDGDGDRGGVGEFNMHTFDTDDLFIAPQRFARRRRRGGGSGAGSYGSQDNDNYYHNDHDEDEDDDGDNEDDEDDDADEEEDDEDGDSDDTWDLDNSSDGEVGLGRGDHFAASMINDPGRATPKQRRWLTAMSDDVDPRIAKRFEQ